MPSITLGQKVKGHYKLILPLLLSLSLIVYGALGLYGRWRATHGTYRPISMAQNTDTPSEQPVSNSYVVSADMPKEIMLPSINVSGFIQQVNVTKNNDVGSPSNVLMAGWYNRSVKPGAPGLSIIDGHVQGVYEPGIFKHLSQLKAGAMITIMFGDNSIKKFQVASVHNYDDANALQPLFAQDKSIPAQLNLITCGGSFDRARQVYDQRTIVVSELID